MKESTSDIRVLNIINNIDINNGIVKYVFEMAKGLKAFGVSSDVIHFNWHSEHLEKNSSYLSFFRELGSKVYDLPNPNIKLLLFIKELDKFFSRNAHKYNIVHIHVTGGNAIFSFFARKYNLDTIVYQSHSSFTGNTLKSIRNYLTSVYTINTASQLVAVTKNTGMNDFGNKDFEVIHAGFNMQPFIYDCRERKQFRNELGISENCFVLGSVSRLHKQKNLIYALNIFKYTTFLESNSKFLIVGDGPERNNLKRLVTELSLEDSVIFLGVRSDLKKVYSGLDVFMCPSFREGAPLSLLEAQASGLVCYVSDVVSDEAILSKNTFKMSIKKDPKYWAKIIVKNGINKNRSVDKNIFKDFDITNNSCLLGDIYKNLIKND